MDVTEERFAPDSIFVQSPLFNLFLSLYVFASPYAVGKRVLDAGCGSGFGTPEFANSGAAYTVGIDNSEEAIKYAKQHYLVPNLSFLLANVTDLPFSDASFDVVFSSNVIEHVAEYDRFLQEVRRVLSPGGLFLMATPPVQRDDIGSDNQFHVTNLSPASWSAVLGKHFAQTVMHKHAARADLSSTGFMQKLAAAVETVRWAEASPAYRSMGEHARGALRHAILNPSDINEGTTFLQRVPLGSLAAPDTVTVVAMCSNGTGARLDSELGNRALEERRLRRLEERNERVEKALLELFFKYSGDPTQLPRAGLVAKAWRALMAGGPPQLWQEARTYLKWRLSRRD